MLSADTVLCLVTQSCLTLCGPMDCSSPGSSVHGDSPGKNTRVGCHALLQAMSPMQGLNLGLLHCMQILYYLRHQESPRILEWVTYPFSSRSSQPRNQTGASCIAGKFIIHYKIYNKICLIFHSQRQLPKNIPPSIFIPITFLISPQVCSKIMFIICSKLYCPALPFLREE